MYISIDSGKIQFKLQSLLESKQMSKNRLSVLSGVRFDTIHRFCKGDLSRIDLEILCKLCNTLDCNVEDIIEYHR